MSKHPYIKNLETEKFVLFVSGPFSQWYPSVFQDKNGVFFNSCEQYMMYNKAILFGDQETADKILKTKNPKEQKELGRQVKNFDPEIWDRYCLEIVEKGNLYKFSQNPDLWFILKQTGTKDIVEAADYDPVWGIKLGAYDPAAQDPAQWQGKNYLGEALMKVRQVLNSLKKPTPFTHKIPNEHYVWSYNALPLKIPGMNEVTTLKAVADAMQFSEEDCFRIINNVELFSLQVPGYNKKMHTVVTKDFKDQNPSTLQTIAHKIQQHRARQPGSQIRPHKKK